MNPLDLSVIIFLAASGLLAFARGFVREVLSIGSWVISGYLATHFYPAARPFVLGVVQKSLLTDVVTAGGLFVLFLLVLSVVVGVISSRVRGSVLGGTDRVLGLAFGLGRAAILLCLCYLLAVRLVPIDTWPSWAVDARSRPLIAAGAATMEAMIPRNLLDQGTRAIDKAGKSVGTAASAADALKALGPDPAPTPARGGDAARNSAEFDTLRQPPTVLRGAPGGAAPGYDAEAARQMDRAFQSVGVEHK